MCSRLFQLLERVRLNVTSGCGGGGVDEVEGCDVGCWFAGWEGQ